MACTIVGFRPLGTTSIEPHRAYTQIVVYERDGDKVVPIRVTRSPHGEYWRALDIRQLYRGHCAWIARDLAERNARPARSEAPRKAA